MNNGRTFSISAIAKGVALRVNARQRRQLEHPVDINNDGIAMQEAKHRSSGKPFCRSGKQYQ